MGFRESSKMTSGRVKRCCHANNATDCRLLPVVVDLLFVGIESIKSRRPRRGLKKVVVSVMSLSGALRIVLHSTVRGLISLSGSFCVVLISFGACSCRFLWVSCCTSRQFGFFWQYWGEIYSNRIAVTGTFDLNLRDLDEG